MASIGPTFFSELRAAGLGDIPVFWNIQSGELSFEPSVSETDQANVRAVLTAHDPTKPFGPRMATGRQLRYALNAAGLRAAWDAAVTLGKPNDRDYWLSLGSRDDAPQTNPKLARIAAASKIDLPALFESALSL